MQFVANLSNEHNKSYIDIYVKVYVWVLKKTEQVNMLEVSNKVI